MAYLTYAGWDGFDYTNDDDATLFHDEGYHFALIGAAMHSGATTQNGQDDGPMQLRAAPFYPGAYDYRTNTDIAGIKCADLGDATTSAQLMQMIRWVYKNGNETIPIVVGGDDSICVHGVDAVRQYQLDEMQLVHFDAHLDVQEGANTLGAYDHSTWVSYALFKGISRVFHYGHRTLSDIEPPDELTRLDPYFTTYRYPPDKPTVIAFDLDVIDPSEAPGVGCPVAGGERTSFMCTYLTNMMVEVTHVQAVFITEYAPCFDRRQQTASVIQQLINAVVVGKARVLQGLPVLSLR